jgi:hypothetical protein
LAASANIGESLQAIGRMWVAHAAR